MEEQVRKLKKDKLRDFNTQLKTLREIMQMIGKTGITLNTSEPIGVGHSYGLDKKYSIQVSLTNITFMDNSNRTHMIDDAYINSCKWFQVYIYIVEMELEMKKILKQINDSHHLSLEFD